MNRRAKMRLIVVSAIILILGVAGYFTLMSGDNTSSKTVSTLLSDKQLVGQRIKVAGTVVDGSWDGKANPMHFEVRDADGTSSVTMRVVYQGVVPSSFGDKTKAILTGTLGKDGIFSATDMLTECPSKYKAGTAETVDQLLSQGTAIVGKPVKVIGFCATDPVSGRFTLQASSAGGKTVQVSLVGNVPPRLKAGAQVTVSGSLGKNGVFDATTVDVATAASS